MLAEETLDLRTVQIHRQHAVGTGRLQRIEADASADGDAGLILFIAFCIGEKGYDGGDLRGRGELERIDPEEKLHKILINGIVDALDYIGVFTANIFENADEGVAFAEGDDLGFRGIDAELLADSATKLLRGAPDDDGYLLALILFHSANLPRAVRRLGYQFRSLKPISNCRVLMLSPS